MKERENRQAPSQDSEPKLDPVEEIYKNLLAEGERPGVDTMRKANLIYDKQKNPEKFRFYSVQ